MNWWQIILLIVVVTLCVGLLTLFAGAVAYAVAEIKKDSQP